MRRPALSMVHSLRSRDTLSLGPEADRTLSLHQMATRASLTASSSRCVKQGGPPVGASTPTMTTLRSTDQLPWSISLPPPLPQNYLILLRRQVIHTPPLNSLLTPNDMLEAETLPFSPAQTLEIDRQRCPALMSERNEHLDLMPLSASFVEAAGRSWRTELKGLEKVTDRKGQGLKCVSCGRWKPSCRRASGGAF